MIPHLSIRIPQGILVGTALSSIVFFPLILGGVDEKASKTKSSSRFQVLRYHTGQLTLRRYPFKGDPDPIVQGNETGPGTRKAPLDTCDYLRVYSEFKF